jgi:WD40 repeat protein
VIPVILRVVDIIMLNLQDSVTCVQFNYDGSYVATGDMSGVIQVWKIASKSQVWETHVGDLTVSFLN